MLDELADAIACTLLQQIEEYQQHAKGIPVGDTGLAIDEVQYEDDELSIGIRLTDGTTWELRPQEVRPTPPTAKIWGLQPAGGRHRNVNGRIPSDSLVERLIRERATASN